jgi:hypothetical protein
VDPGADQPTWEVPEQLVAAGVASSCMAGEVAENIAEAAGPWLGEAHLSRVAS